MFFSFDIPEMFDDSSSFDDVPFPKEDDSSSSVPDSDSVLSLLSGG